MFRRLVIWAVRSYIGGPARSWIFTSAAVLALRLVRSTTGRQELVDLSSVKPGQTLIIEHLPISHRRQIRDLRQERKAQRRIARRIRRSRDA
ncbi:MAG: hypothetical protein AAF547_00910 [Actinomycetota bacterium]